MLEGNPGHRPLPEVMLVSGRPLRDELSEPPADLPVEAQEFWRDSVAALVDVGLVDRVDVPILRQLAIQYSRITKAQKVIDADGFFVRGSVGQIREHPALKIERDATVLFFKMAEHYGLTPVARTRLGLAELHRRSLQQEMETGLKKPNFTPVLTDEDGDEITDAVVAEASEL